MLAARTFHNGGIAMVLRYVVNQNSATATGRIHSIALWRSSRRSSRAAVCPDRRVADSRRVAAGTLGAVMTVRPRGLRCTRVPAAHRQCHARRRARSGQ